VSRVSKTGFRHDKNLLANIEDTKWISLPAQYISKRLLESTRMLLRYPFSLEISDPAMIQA